MVRRVFRSGLVMLTAAMSGLATWAIWTDHQSTLRLAEQRMAAVSRLVVAHAEGALIDAERLTQLVTRGVADWDFREPVRGAELFSQLKDLIIGAPHISSAWVVDNAGVSVLDTWSYPPQPISAAERPYFQLHLAGAADPVIAGDSRPGTVTGKVRFTYSRALREADGRLRGAVVVAIYSEQFSSLYAEATAWPGARAALHGRDGPLVATDGTVPISRAFEEGVAKLAASGKAGRGTVAETDGDRLVAWASSTVVPGVFATTSQPQGLVLADWYLRSAVTVMLSALFLIASVLLGSSFVRAAEARQQALFQQLAAREAHHRVKNSLQIASGMLSRRARQADGEVRAELEEAASQVRAIADVHEILQEAGSEGEVEMDRLILKLTAQLARTAPGLALDLETNAAWSLDAQQATAVAIMLNELITNALKHARQRVVVRSQPDAAGHRLEVADDGPGLPEGFAVETSHRFGLRTVAMMAQRFGGGLLHESSQAGARFTVIVPVGSST